MPYHKELDEIDAILTTTVDSEDFQAQHEQLQDAIFTRDDKCVIAQCKYTTVSKKIYIGEAREIIEKLDNAAEDAKAEEQNVTACVLVTNRELASKGKGGESAEQYWKKAKEDREGCYELRYVPCTLVDLESDLCKFARSYGLFNHEIRDGVDRLVGRVFRQTGDLFGTSLSKCHLIESFTGCRQARPLITDGIREQSRKDIERLGETVVVEQWNREPVKREVYEDIIQAINEQRALIHLYGPGGCGKSILMWQLLDQLPPKRCCAVIHAEQVLRTWVEGTVHSWRNLPGNTEDTADMALQRLMIANPTSPKPIVWLALDGLDEGHLSPDRESNIRDVLQWFWSKDRNRTNEPPPATLIVSCREESDLHRWLQFNPFSRREPPLSIYVGDFSKREFKRAFDQKFPGLYNRMQPASFSVQSEPLWDDYDMSLFGSWSPTDRLDSLDERVLTSLRHPAMWLAILDLDHETQIRAIKGEQQAVHVLARKFIEWFGYKLRRRKQQLQDLVDLVDDDLIKILGMITQHSSGTTANSRGKAWVEPARRTPHQLSGREAVILYDEALSAGLVEEDSRRVWRWRHPIVYDYLLSSRQEG